MNNDPNQPGSTPDRPTGETPGAHGAPDETSLSGQPTERVTPPDFQPPPAPDPSQFTMPQPQTTIYSPQPGPAAGGGPGNTPPAYTQPVGGTPPPQQPYGGEQARAPQQGYPAPGQYPPGQPPQGQFTPPGQYQQQGNPPPGQYPQGQYPLQYPQGNVPPGQPPYPQPAYNQPPQPLPKKGGVPVIVWIIGGLVAVLLLVCGITAYMATQVISNAGRSLGDAFETVEANVGGIPSWLFYNDLNAGDYESARDYLSADLKREYSAARLQEEWERLVEGAGGITVGDYVTIGNDNNLWLQELEGQENGQFYEIEVTVRTIGSDYLITDAKPSLIPEP